MPCSFCKAELVVAKGLCRNCYYRQKKTGSLEYKRWGKSLAACAMEGCTQPVIARGYCEAHYRSVLKHGDPISAFGYGERRKHPLYEVWRWQARVAEGRVDAWSDFWQFVADVPTRPSEQHVARRYDNRKPWGQTNFYWREQSASSASGKQLQRLWRAAHPLRYKDYDLRRSYGLTLGQYMEMYEAQAGKCAICEKRGSTHDSKNGRAKTLVVDHCHASKKRRALLCADCNKALGGFQDSVDVLKKAIAYLRRHE